MKEEAEAGIKGLGLFLDEVTHLLSFLLLKLPVFVYYIG